VQRIGDITGLRPRTVLLILAALECSTMTVMGALAATG
jgi:hypothetical protein